MGDADNRSIIEGQRADWNRVAPAWEKWDRLLDENLAFLNHRLVADARLRHGQRVLDVGSGTGYPAVLAAQIVGSSGRVTGLDLADEMLAVARRKAESLGLTNVTFQSGDATKLPFETGSFDAVISRFCLMFLPDIPSALAEFSRVLVPGGYTAVAVWSAPERNPFVSIPMTVLKTMITLPPQQPDQPGIFRLAKAGDLAGMMQHAGLEVLEEDELAADYPMASAQEYLDSLMDVAAPIQNLMAQIPPAQQDTARKRIKQAAEAFGAGGTVRLPIAVRVVSARKAGAGTTTTSTSG